MVIFRDITASQLLKYDFRSGIRSTMAVVARNPSIATLWFVAIYAGVRGLIDYRNLKDITEYSNRWQIDALYEALKLGFYCLISIIAAGFALVLASLKKTGETLSSTLLVDGIDVDVPVILEEKRLEGEARAELANTGGCHRAGGPTPGRAAASPAAHPAAQGRGGRGGHRQRPWRLVGR